MSTSDNKSKQTLAKKLSAKRVPLKREVELKPELFSEVKNNKRTKLAKGSKKNEEDTDICKEETKLKKSKVKSEDVDAGDASDLKKSKRSTRSRNLKEDLQQEAPLEIVYTGKSSVLKNEPFDSTPSTSSSAKTKIKQGDGSTPKTTSKKKEELSNIKDAKKEPIENKWEPINWRTILENIRTMRLSDNAPVDTMGCHKCADENVDEKTQRFHKLVALMLSSQTKDETTYHAMLRLREHNLTPEVISEMKLNVLENILHPVSFYKNKAKYMQQTSKILIDKYNSDIPNNIKELVALPGVGPKMAHICMATAWQKTTGIGVDVHVHRISNRLQWVPHPTKEPEQTRMALEQWLPRDLWREVNYLLVGFGQTTCTPVKPKCLECLNCNICPSAPKGKKTEENMHNAEVLNICDKAKFKKKKMHL